MENNNAQDFLDLYLGVLKLPYKPRMMYLKVVYSLMGEDEIPWSTVRDLREEIQKLITSHEEVEWCDTCDNSQHTCTCAAQQKAA